MGETLDVREGNKWKLCHHSAIKSGKESTGSQMGTVKEPLAIERTSEHLQQATRADKTMWKAKKPRCPPLCTHKKGKYACLTPSHPQGEQVSLNNSSAIVKVLHSDQLNKLLGYWSVFCSLLVHFI